MARFVSTRLPGRLLQSDGRARGENFELARPDKSVDARFFMRSAWRISFWLCAALLLTTITGAAQTERLTLLSTQLRPIEEAGVPVHVNGELIKAMGHLGLLPRLFPGLAGEARSRVAAVTVRARDI